MGKYLETKYSDLQNRVIKKPNKINQRLKGNEHHVSSGFRRKRKVYCVKDDKENKREESSIAEQKSAFSNLQFEIQENLTSGNFYVKPLKQDDDLFSNDVLNMRYDQYTKFNFISLILDEIALEGLDGITLEALWKRLSVACKYPTYIDQIKNSIWQILCLNDELKFFELPTQRPNLFIFNRNDYTEEMDEFMTAYNKHLDIYKIQCSPKGEIWGSCTTLNTRIDISEKVRNMSLKEVVSTYQNKLVIVADQKLRTNALFDDLTDINYDIMPIEYCILERIGRSREIGEITQGISAVGNVFNMDSKTIHHYKKRLSNQHLITKQFFNLHSCSDQNRIGRLLHLRRFYVKRKSKYLAVTEAIINYLKKCPGYMLDYSTLRYTFGKVINSKFWKNSEFLKYVDTAITLPYKELHPNASFKEYMVKNLTKERMIKMAQLKNPHINIVANWSDNANIDSSDDEDESEENCNTSSRSRSLNLEFLRELYLYIKSKGIEGCSNKEVQSVFDVDFASRRACLKKLINRQVVSFKKIDEGKQRYNQYIATCLLNHSAENTIIPQEVAVQPSSVVEKLKQRQMQKIKALGRERVYSLEQFETDHNLALEKSSYLQASLKTPSINCQFLITTLSEPIELAKSSYKVEFNKIKEYFKINLICPKISNRGKIQLNLIFDKPGLQNVTTLKPDINLDNIYKGKMKLDYLTKAILLRILLDNTETNIKEMIEFLDSDHKKSGRTLKRKHPQDDKRTEQSKIANITAQTSLIKKEEMLDFMGPNPIVVSTEKKENDIVVDIIMSTPPTEYITGDITGYKSTDLKITDRLLSRIHIILNEINSCKVFEEMNKLIKIISKKENEEGYNKTIDKKSLYRIIRKLVCQGYIKVYEVIVSEKNSRKKQNFLCHPEVDHNHDIIKLSIGQIVWKFLLNDTQPVEVTPIEVESEQNKEKENKQSSPFVEMDVRQSIQELRGLRNRKHTTLKLKPSKKAGRFYGFRPKFAKTSVFHELLFYLIYELDRKTEPLSKEETLSLFKRYQINLTEPDFEKLPPIYCKEISWKMFIPPLPQHHSWDDGWALVCDIILRIPLTLIVKLHCINYLCSDLSEILQHPIKRFYLLKNIPSQVQTLILYRRKYIHDIYDIVVRLAYCGLVQFGPSRHHEKDQVFIYLNRRASLMETMPSEPAYNKISVMDYNKVYFEFNTISDIIKYWSTMYTICMNTRLNSRNIMLGKTITLESERCKPSMILALTPRTQQEVKKYDKGNIPGDQRGAAGLDSSMWSHINRNWFFISSHKGIQTFEDDLASLKLDQSLKEQVAFDQLKIPTISSKFYLSKFQEVKVHTRPVKLVKPNKTNPIVQRKLHFVKKKQTKKEYYDPVDKAILRKFNACLRFRPVWSEEEDKILILLKIAATFLNPKLPTKSIIQYSVMRDVLHRIIPSSRDKTSRALPRRWKIISRDMPIISNIDKWLANLYKLNSVAEYFAPLRTYIQHEIDSSDRPFKLTDMQMQIAFVFFSYYIITHREEVQTALDGNMTTIDYFNEENLEFSRTTLNPFKIAENKYIDPTSTEDIRKCVLKNLIQSALGDRKENPAWSYQLYKIYQKFNDAILKSTITELRDQRMISYKKDSIRKFYTPFKIHLHYIFSQCTTFTYTTIEEVFKIFLNIKDTSNTLQFTPAIIEKMMYGQLLAINEIVTFKWNNINLKFSMPKNPFILDPTMEDHSELIEELAKRYQAKLKTEQKETDLLVSSEYITDNTLTLEPIANTSQKEIVPPDDDEPLDLTTTLGGTFTIDNLKHWISDCIDTERVRSPSPELLNIEVKESLNKTPEQDENTVNDVLEQKEVEQHILPLEKIKEEMLKVTVETEKRIVPYITDLTKLLTENFDDIDTDEHTIDRLKKHFIQQYPILEEFKVDNFPDDIMVDYLENRLAIKNIWEKILREQHITLPDNVSEAFEEIYRRGGTIEDVNLANDIIGVISEKEVLGITGPELKEKFCQVETTCSLELILTILTDHKILLKTGVCGIRFVHHKHESTWLIESFVLTGKYEKPLVGKNENKLDKLKEDIDNTMKTTPWIKIKAHPWNRVDGTLNKDLFKLWLSNIFSYCIENPRTLLLSLFEKFSFITPVDIFYLIEVLEELGCLELRRFSFPNNNPFSEYELLQESKATFLDKFEDIFIEINNVAFISLGSFFHNI